MKLNILIISLEAMDSILIISINYSYRPNQNLISISIQKYKAKLFRPKLLSTWWKEKSKKNNLKEISYSQVFPIIFMIANNGLKPLVGKPL